MRIKMLTICLSYDPIATEYNIELIYDSWQWKNTHELSEAGEKATCIVEKWINMSWLYLWSIVAVS